MSGEWITLDGSQGEGGGQIVRTAVGLSLVTGKRVRITNIRAGRRKPGLQRQHLTAVLAASEVGQAETEGACLGSQQLSFTPGRIKSGNYQFEVGTAGSTGLVLQTLLPALMTAAAPSTLVLRGGTHNPMAPPFDFLLKTYLPLLSRLGPKVQATLIRPGFFPAGGGEVKVLIEPCSELSALELPERGATRRLEGRILLARLPRHIAERELAVLRNRLDWPQEQFRIEQVTSGYGPGNAVILEMESEKVTEVVTAFGQRGLAAETVASQAAEEGIRYLASEAPVGEHLADQLLIPLAMAGGGAFLTGPLSSHARTNAEIIKRFLTVDIVLRESGQGQGQTYVEVRGLVR